MLATQNASGSGMKTSAIEMKCVSAVQCPTTPGT
jgi:hypothetical protein